MNTLDSSFFLIGFLRPSLDFCLFVAGQRLYPIPGFIHSISWDSSGSRFTAPDLWLPVDGSLFTAPGLWLPIYGSWLTAPGYTAPGYMAPSYTAPALRLPVIRLPGYGFQVPPFHSLGFLRPGPDFCLSRQLGYLIPGFLHSTSLEPF